MGLSTDLQKYLPWVHCHFDGLPEMHVADLSGDMRVLKQAQTEAQAVLAADPALEAPENRPLKERITTLFELHADTFN